MGVIRAGQSAVQTSDGVIATPVGMPDTGGDREKARVDAALIAARSQLEQTRERSVKYALNWSIGAFIGALLTVLIGIWAWSRVF